MLALKGKNSPKVPTLIVSSVWNGYITLGLWQSSQINPFPLHRGHSYTCFVANLMDFFRLCASCPDGTCSKSCQEDFRKSLSTLGNTQVNVNYLL